MKRVLLSIIALAVFATGALAELKMGYIDSEVLKERLPEFRDAQRVVQADLEIAGALRFKLIGRPF